MKGISKFLLSIFTFLIFFVIALPADAQNRDFQKANTFLQQQNYEEALPIFRELHQNDPTAYIFFERLTETLINLHEYEEAIEITEYQIENNHSLERSKIRLAEIHHLSGDKELAHTTWNEVLSGNDLRVQTFYNVAGSMSSRREYESAIEVYKTAQDRFNNPELFTSEMASTYMQAGQFEDAMAHYFRVIEKSPGQMGFVQQRLLRMRDQELFEVAALELEDFLLELDMDHQSYHELYQLLSWLLLETEEYRRAYVFARQYENQTEQTNYSLYSLGNRFTSAHQYELAVEVYSYYAEDESSQRFRAMDELATTYVRWARYLKQHSIDTFGKPADLYKKAYDINEEVIESAPYYNRLDRVLSSQIDLSLDQFKDAELAERWLDVLKELDEEMVNEPAYISYAEGRIALFNKDFTSARQALTRADRATDESNLSERSRYYLSLSDFYAGDYEFADIQLRSLERRSTSYFANNAIQLRMWIKNGTRADTTGAILDALGEGMHHIHTGNYDDAIDQFSVFIDAPNHPFSDDVTVELAKTLPERYQPYIFHLLETQASAAHHSPLFERILWERARSAEYLTRLYQTSPDIFDEQNWMDSANFDIDSPDRYNFSDSDLDEMYEQILHEFPGGFYAQYAREKLQLSGSEPTL